MRRLIKFCVGVPSGSGGFFQLVVGGPRGGAAVLWDEVLTVLESASIIPREPNDDGPRTFVLSPSLGCAFVFTTEDAANRISKAWPELSDAMVGRAVRYLASRVMQRQQPLPQAKRRNWVHDYGWSDGK